MGQAGGYSDLVANCRERGSDIDEAEFRASCQRLARILAPDWDSDGTPEHFDLLLEKKDHVAALLLIIPTTWGYSYGRSIDGVARAQFELPGRGLQDEVVSDNETAALLGAFAAALGASGVNHA